ncbi:hypothetical protein NST99_17955 [Paenibacillus sp. FSL L8-0470]|uniref:hypothetical protein n=1 Tax=Paenibacillus sp. FSL L8-0470 TaxID=2954688 RepID=UPI0030F9081C
MLTKRAIGIAIACAVVKTRFGDKNKLFPSEEKAVPATSSDELSKEDEMKLAFMMEGMERRSIVNLIENN